jgi:hypothetical protein
MHDGRKNSDVQSVKSKSDSVFSSRQGGLKGHPSPSELLFSAAYGLPLLENREKWGTQKILERDDAKEVPSAARTGFSTSMHCIYRL